jgi:Ca2+-binding RTX toxin-like protein
MATINYYPDFPASLDGPGSVTAADTTRLVITHPTFTETYYGTLAFQDGMAVGGTVRAVEYVNTAQGEPFFRATGLELSAVTVGQLLASGQVLPLLQLIFSDTDTIGGSIAPEVISGYGGNDVIVALDGNDTVSGDAGDDDVNGNIGDDRVSGGDGADIVRGGKGNDTIWGDAGNDPHVNGNIGDDLVYGGAGNDSVFGGQDQDTLHGGDGSDLLSGDRGQDILYGDAGADWFFVGAGSGFDWAADFNPGEGDHILLAVGTAYTVASVDGQAVIDLGNGDALGLAGVAAASFDPGWIVFN